MEPHRRRELLKIRQSFLERYKLEDELVSQILNSDNEENFKIYEET